MNHGADTQKWTGWIYLTDVCTGCETTTTTVEQTTTTVAGPSTTVTVPEETTTTVAGPSTTQGGPTTTDPELPYTGGTSSTPAAPLGIAALVLLLAGLGFLVQAESVKSR